MIRIYAWALLWAIVALATPFGRCQEAASQIWDLNIRKVPPGFVSSQTGKNIEDITAAVTKMGIDFPKGSLALYDREAGRVFIRNTPGNAALWDSLAGHCTFGVPLAINYAVEIRIFEGPAKVAGRTSATGQITYSALEAFPAASLKILDQFSVVGRSGRQFNLALPESNLPSLDKKALDPKAHIELLAAADARTVDFLLDCRLPLASPGGKPIFLPFKGQCKLTLGEPAVIHTAPAGESSTFIVCATVRSFDAGNREIPPAPTGQNQSASAHP